MDGRDVIIMLLAALVFLQTKEIGEMTTKWRISDDGWTVALRHLREHNVPLPTSEECERYLKDVGRR